MIIAGRYSFKGGLETLKEKYTPLLREIEGIITKVDASKCETSESGETTKRGRALYNPKQINKAFVLLFSEKDWSRSKKVQCGYSTNFYTSECHQKPKFGHNRYRQMDFVKDKVGVEIQLGHYPFVMFDVCFKMPIFHKAGIINVGVEVIPVKSLDSEMSQGGARFENTVWDLEHRGVSDIDIPVLILGIDK